MVEAMSYKGYFGIAKEDTADTAKEAEVFLPILSEDIAVEKEIEIPEEIRNNRDRVSAIEMQQLVGGDVEFQPAYENGFGHVINGVLGGYESEELVENEAYKHTWTGGDDLDPYTAEINTGGELMRQASGCKFDSLEFTAEGGEIVTTSFSILGMSNDTGITEQTPDLSMMEPIKTYDVKIEIDDTERNCDVESFDLSIENNLFDDIYGLGKKGRCRIVEGLRDITGTMEIAFDSDDYDDFIDDNEMSIELTVEGGDIGTTQHEFKLLIDLPRVKYESSDIGMSGGDRVINSVDFVALFDDFPEDPDEDGYAIKIELTNSKDDDEY